MTRATEAMNPYSSEHFIAIDFADGTVARWAIPNDDDRIDAVAEAIEVILGQPDTTIL